MPPEDNPADDEQPTQQEWEAHEEEVALGHMPSIHDLASKTNPVPWHEFLLTRCEVRGEDACVVWYGASNCNHIVYRDRVFSAHGYHARPLFDKLRDPTQRPLLFADMLRVYRTLKNVEVLLDKRDH